MNFNLRPRGLHARARQVFYDQVVERVGGAPRRARRGHRAERRRSPAASPRSVFPEGADTTTTRPHPRAGEHRRPRLLPDDRHPDRARPRLHARRHRRRRPRSSSSTRRWRSSSGRAKKRSASASSSSATRTTPRSIGVAQRQQVQRRRRGAACPSSISRSRRTTRRRRRCTCDRPATPPSLAAPVRRAVQQLDPTLSVFNVRTLEEQVGQFARSRCR